MAQSTVWEQIWAWLRAVFRGFVTTHPWFKFFSLALAVGMWLWVQGDQVIEGRIEVDVQYRWPEHLVLTSAPPQRIEAVIRGTRSEVRRARNRNLLMRVNMQEANPGVQTLSFVTRDIEGLPQGVVVETLRQRDYEVVLEPRRDRRVEIVANTIGEPGRDHKVSGITLEPEHVWIEGPSSMIAELDSVETVGVPLANQRETFTADVDVVLPSRYLNRKDDELIRVTVEVEQIIGTKTYNDVPVRPPPGWQATEASVRVTLSGPISILTDLDVSGLQVLAALPVDALRVPTMLSADTFEVIHGGPASVRVVDVVPGQVGFEPIPEPEEDPPEEVHPEEEPAEEVAPEPPAPEDEAP